MAKRKKTTIYLVDDHMVVIEGIRMYLSGNADFEIVGHTASGRDAVKQVKSLKPDIVIMDIFMPDFNGILATYEIKKSRVKTKIIAYSMSSDKEHVLSLFKAGASGFVLKGDSLEDLLRALEAVKSGGTYYSRIAEKHIRDHMRELELGDAARVMEIDNGIARLSLREKEVFPLLADGRSIKEIAEILCISPKTVESHKYNIMGKLGVSSMASLTKLAIQKGLINIE
jgi:DNA-binding NarL/FixJ family response regulator